MVRFEDYEGKEAKLSVKLGKEILFFEANCISVDNVWITFRDRYG